MLAFSYFSLTLRGPSGIGCCHTQSGGSSTSIKIQTKHAYTRSIIEPEQAVFINLEYEGIMYRQLMKTEGMDWKESKQDYMRGPEGGKGRGGRCNYIIV